MDYYWNGEVTELVEEVRQALGGREPATYAEALATIEDRDELDRLAEAEERVGALYVPRTEGGAIVRAAARHALRQRLGVTA